MRLAPLRCPQRALQGSLLYKGGALHARQLRLGQSGAMTLLPLTLAPVFCVSTTCPCPAVLHGFQASPAAAARMQVELRSRGLLVCWVALCGAHAAAAQQHTMLLQFGVAVDWEDLKHLVLSDRPAEDAALAVASYLRRHTQPGRPAFSLADGGKATFDLARQYALADARLLQIWQQETGAAAHRRDAHWAEIQRKQAEVARLRTQLEQQKRVLESARSDVSAAHLVYNSERFEGHERMSTANAKLKQAQNRMSFAQQAVSSTEAHLRSALVPPSPVIQPLPEHHSAAATWLFFLYMPPALRWALSLRRVAADLCACPINTTQNYQA